MRNKTRFSRQRGMAFLAVMVVLMFLLAITLVGVLGNSGGLSSQAKNGIASTQRRLRTGEAMNLAESGIYSTLQWLTQQAGPPQNTSAFAPGDFFGGVASSGYTQVTFPLGTNKSGTFKVRIYPYSTNATKEQKYFIIESVGNFQGQQQIVRATAFQDTFAKYAYFVDIAPDPNSWWVSASTQFQGPVHMNATAAAGSGTTANILWKYSTNTTTQAANQIFTYTGGTAFTTSATSINWNKNTLGTSTAPATSTDWANISATGQAGVQLGVTPIPLPAQSTMQADSARGTVSKATMDANPKGVYLPSGGGVYIRGDVDNMVMSTSGAVGGGLNAGGTGDTNQIVTIYQTDTSVTPNKQVRYTVTTNPTTNTTVVQKATATLNSTSFGSNTTVASATGTTNKVIYSDGNIGKQVNLLAVPPVTSASGGVSGNIANALTSGGNITSDNKWTISTAPDKTLNIAGNIKMLSDSMINSTTPTKASGTLGLVSGHVQITDQTANTIGNASGTNITSATIHATVVAFDTFDVTNASTRGYTGQAISSSSNKITILGGYIAKKNGQFGSVWYDGNLRSGFTRNLVYDPRVAFNPPPYFPTTANRYQIGSIQRVTSTLE